jgi:predicted RNA binding protein YcfA (HicA-like mRNA interferase family)
MWDRQVGSHVALRHPETGRTATIPDHGAHDLPVGTLRDIIRDAGLSVEEFRRLLK